MTDWSYTDSNIWSGTQLYPSAYGGTYTTSFNKNASTTTMVFNEYLDWLPKSCTHKKYFPSWHLVRSYVDL